MLNQHDYDYLKWGRERWNNWREENPYVKPNLSNAYLFGASLSRTDLNSVNLSSADLFGADLFGADLQKANLNRANLNKADLAEADLSGADLSGADLTEADLSGADLTQAILVDACLDGANLSRAKLNFANLTGATLTNSRLIEAHALGTNFVEVDLTAACIESWNINADTNLERVICKYVYLRANGKERRPCIGTFMPGEFTKLFQKALETVDLIFLNGIKWSALLASLNQLKVEYDGKEISVQAIEKKKDGAFIIRVEVPADVNKADVETYLKHKYQLALESIERRYQLQVKAKDDQIQSYRQHNVDLTEIVKSFAGRTINVQAIANARSNTMADNSSSKYDLRGCSIGNFADTVQSGARQQAIQHHHTVAPQQTSTDVTAELEQLFRQLAQTYATTPDREKPRIAATALQQKAQANPNFKRRLLSAAEAGSLQLLTVLDRNPFVSIPIAAIKGWIKAD